MDFFAHSKNTLHAHIIFVVTIFLNIILGIPFWFFCFGYYRSSIIPSVELGIYITISITLGLALILFQRCKIKEPWKYALNLFMSVTVLTNLILAFGLWSYDFDQYSGILPTECDILSPDRQKIYHVKNVEPSSASLEIWVSFNHWPYPGKVLGYGLGGETDFCAARWADNDTLFVPNIFDSDHLNQTFVNHRINYFEFNWLGLIWCFVCSGLAAFLGIFIKVIRVKHLSSFAS